MLEPTMHALAGRRIVLASGSPRRKEIVEKLFQGMKVEIVPSTYNEDLERSKYDTHGEYVQDLAQHKVQEVYERLKNDPIPPSLIIGADTLVTLGDVIYGKPKNRTDAFEMLSRLSGERHVVFTGVCLKTLERELQFYESTCVKFGDISAAQIRSYVKTGEPLDKAGGYGVQGAGACLIERIEGDFYTVMGLPLYMMTKKLNEIFADAESHVV